MISFIEPAPWLKTSYQDMNAALLSLHHAGYIVYGANIVKLTDKVRRHSAFTST